MKRVASFALAFLLANLLIVVSQVSPAKASGTIYIRSDGSIDPPSAPISREGSTYYFTDNINDSVVVERSNIIINGGRNALQGAGSGMGLYLTSSVNNVTVKNTTIKNFDHGIFVYLSSFNTVSGNCITANNLNGIFLRGSSNNNISGNNITANSDYGICFDSSVSNSICGNSITANSISGIYFISCVNNSISENNIAGNVQIGISLYSSSSNRIEGNNVTANGWHGIHLDSSSSNIISRNNSTANVVGIYLYSSSSDNDISGNNVTANHSGIYLYSSPSNNSVSGNSMTANEYGIYIDSSSGNFIFHNNLVDNSHSFYLCNSANVWDNGYPSGGNYWSNYYYYDMYRGPDQNIKGADGIGDTPYILGPNNTDGYPLMGPCSSTTTGENVTVFPTDDVCLIFESVTEEGLTTVEKPGAGPAPPPGFSVMQYYVIRTTAGYTGQITVRIVYNMLMGTRGDTTQQEDWQLQQYVMLAGDVDEDFDVDILDIVRLAGHYLAVKPDPLYDPQCDIDHDGDIDIFDIVIAAGNYGKTWNPTTGWNDITTRIDWETDSIFGVTNHLSIFGVTKQS